MEVKVVERRFMLMSNINNAAFWIAQIFGGWFAAKDWHGVSCEQSITGEKLVFV